MAEYTDFEQFTSYPIFDGDQHLIEGEDCYTRYIDRTFRDRTLAIEHKEEIRILHVDGAAFAMDSHGGKMARPGSLKEMLKAMKAASATTDDYEWLDPDPAFSDRNLRLDMLDRQNVAACFLFSHSAGLLAEHYILDDDLYYASSWSYLRWLHDEWGFSTKDRLYVAPIFSLRDPKRTADQLEWFYERGGKIVSMVPGPAFGRSPADPYFDEVWARINAAGGLVAYHINEAGPGYKSIRSATWGEPPHPTFYSQSAWQWFWAYGDVPAQETFSSLIYGNLFERFPNLRVVSAEHGSEWIPQFVRKLDKMRGMGRNGPWIGGQLRERPSEVFKRHFRVVPFWEDDVTDVVERVGYEVLLGGSDFPHAEGLASPTKLVEHLSMLDKRAQRFVMRDSGFSLVGSHV